MSQDAVGSDRATALRFPRSAAVPSADPEGPGVAVRLRGLAKSFSRASSSAPVLQGIDLDVASGEFVCLLGASGCGKSTLLNLIAGLEAPTRGQVHVAGGRPALMFQDAALFPWLSASRNVELALRLCGVPRRERQPEAARLLTLVRLAGVGDRRVHELSGGMRQRVALARALAQRSRVLLMDEPFAALDAITRDVLHEELLRIWACTKLSIVFVTHNVTEAVQLGQRLVLLSSRPGRVVQEWRPGADRSGPSAARLVAEITGRLRAEISQHAAPQPAVGA
ncbi:MAG: ABC transporter ATP-binding protein [Candidatus Dormiibacterota bacterium]